MTTRYENGKIYSIRSYQTQDIYIGSTCLELSKRLYEHRNKYKNYQLGKAFYMSSYEILKYEDHYIELIEDCKCETKSQLVRREGQLVRECETAVNKRIDGRTPKEYAEDNKEYMIEKGKQYRDANRDKILEKNKHYYNANKDKISEKKRIKFNCECGGSYTKCDRTKHLRTGKHLTYEANKPP